jgi:hypothetical protein
MKIMMLREDVAKDLDGDGRMRAVLADMEAVSDKIFGVKTYDGPVLFDAGGSAIKRTLPQSLFDKREPWECIKLDTGRGIGRIYTKGEIDDDE